MAPKNNAESPPKPATPKRPPKAGGKTPSKEATEGTEVTYFGPIQFIENTSDVPDAGIKALFPEDHDIWQQGDNIDRRVPAPKWCDFRFGPLPPSGDGKYPWEAPSENKTEKVVRAEAKAKTRFITEAKINASRLEGSRALVNLRTNQMNKGLTQAHAGFTSGAAFSTFLLTEG